jgi:hypothetical protein
MQVAFNTGMRTYLYVIKLHTGVSLALLSSAKEILG